MTALTSTQKNLKLGAHGQKGTPEYSVWVDMKARCFNPNVKSYKSHGARGITVCSAWLRFEAFYEYMGRRPGPGFSLDRMNNDGDYEPGNCRWATWSEQNLNRRNAVIINYKGKLWAAIDLAQHLNMKPDTLRKQVKRNALSFR